jgi:hypothetical protein
MIAVDDPIAIGILGLTFHEAIVGFITMSPIHINGFMMAASD